MAIEEGEENDEEETVLVRRCARLPRFSLPFATSLSAFVDADGVSSRCNKNQGQHIMQQDKLSQRHKTAPG
jgi:hypothetical protein